MSSDNTGKEKIKLKAECFFSSPIHSFIEKFIFCRWQYFKNNGRSNFLIFRAFFSFLSILLLSFLLLYIPYYFFSQCPKLSCERTGSITFKEIFIFLLSGFSLIYWNMGNLVHKKWEYCANLYNKTLESRCRESRAMPLNALAIDILTLDLWATRSFKALFYDELTLSIECLYGKSDPSYGKEIRRKAKMGELSEEDALVLLERRQNKLLNERFPRKTPSKDSSSSKADSESKKTS